MPGRRRSEGLSDNNFNPNSSGRWHKAGPEASPYEPHLKPDARSEPAMDPLTRFLVLILMAVRTVPDFDSLGQRDAGTTACEFRSRGRDQRVPLCDDQ